MKGPPAQVALSGFAESLNIQVENLPIRKIICTAVLIFEAPSV